MAYDMDPNRWNITLFLHSNYGLQLMWIALLSKITTNNNNFLLSTCSQYLSKRELISKHFRKTIERFGASARFLLSQATNLSTFKCFQKVNGRSSECVCDRVASMKTMNETKQKKIFMQIEIKTKTNNIYTSEPREMPEKAKLH